LRSALVLWLMLAAAAQGVIAQAHVHFRFERTAAVGPTVASATPTDDNSTPGEGARGDLSSCALCQVLASGAAPLGPAPRFSLPFAALRDAVPAHSAWPVVVSAVSHIWTSRGPPLI
jgi:hypothetical protein